MCRDAGGGDLGSRRRRRAGRKKGGRSRRPTESTATCLAGRSGRVSANRSCCVHGVALGAEATVPLAFLLAAFLLPGRPAGGRGRRGGSVPASAYLKDGAGGGGRGAVESDCVQKLWGHCAPSAVGCTHLPKVTSVRGWAAPCCPSAPSPPPLSSLTYFCPDN